MNNQKPWQGKGNIYETHDSSGDILEQFRDNTGAENARRDYERKKYGLKDYPALSQVLKRRDGKIIPMDSGLRNTTGGSGGAAGPGGV